MVARPVYTFNPRNFTFYRPVTRPAQIGQQVPSQTPGAIPGQPFPGGGPMVPIAVDPTPPAPAEESPRVTVVWPYLVLASFVGGAAFALGTGLVNRYVWGKE